MENNISFETAKVIAVDFDGTLAFTNYPTILGPNQSVIDRLKTEQDAGAKIILWTCRENTHLQDAITWCAKQGIRFDAVNENLPERIEQWHTDPRKIGADEYWDDKSINPTIIIRCKECKYYDKDSIDMSGFFFCEKISTQMDVDDYCSYAERKREKED